MTLELAFLEGSAADSDRNERCIDLYGAALKAAGVMLSPTILKEEIKTRRGFPAIGAFTDWAASQGVEVRVFRSDLSDLPSLAPCLALHKDVSGRLTPLAMLRDARDGEILIEGGILPEAKDGPSWVPVERLQSLGCEIVIKVTPPESAAAAPFQALMARNASAIWRERAVKGGAILGIGLIFTALWATISNASALAVAAHLALSVIGLGLAVELVLLTLGRNSGLAPKLCDATALTISGCGNALSSPLSKAVPWIGLPLATLGYFLTMSLAVGLTAMMPGVLGWVMIISGIASLAGVGSLYYQGFILKDWCTLCCIMVGVLALQAVIGLWFLAPMVTTSAAIPGITGLVILIALFALVFSVITVVQPYLHGAVHFAQSEARYKNLIQTPHVLDSMYKGEPLDMGQVEGDILLGDLAEDAVEVALIVSIGCNDCSIAIRDIDRMQRIFGDGVRVRLRLFVKYFKIHCDLSDEILSASANGRHTEAFTRLLEETSRSLRLTPESSIPADPKNYSTALQAQTNWYEAQNLTHVPLITFQGHVYNHVRVEDLQYLIANAAALVRASRRKAA